MKPAHVQFRDSMFKSNGIRYGATFNEPRTHRLSLYRSWGPVRGVPVHFVMLNPSTADGFDDDPTIRKCMAFARAWGFSALRVSNVYGFRATQPKTLLAMISEGIGDAIGEGNFEAIEENCRLSAMTVCAWGRHACGPGLAVAKATIASQPSHKVTFLRLNKDGSPAHPLYLPLALTPTPYPSQELARWL